MGLVVQKYGGSSLATVAHIGHVAGRIVRRRQAGDDVVVVVSAMQGETDRLLRLAHTFGAAPSAREVDQLVATGEQASAALLALALQAQGVAARSLTGAQLQLRTDGSFSRARIHSLRRAAVDDALQAGAVVVATGFVGVDASGNLTTLGRGGSDTSAVALAAALHAEACEIYTDVIGVHTADPRLCPKARRIAHITFDEMMEMASLGAKILQIRCVELAMNHNVPLHVRSTFSDEAGTTVSADANHIERVCVRGISHSLHEAKLTLRRLPDRSGIVAEVFSALAQADINVDVIVQNVAEGGHTDLSFTTLREHMPAAEAIVAGLAARVQAQNIEVDASVGKVSIVGVGMMSHPGVAARMFAALQAANIHIVMITTSEIKVTCVIATHDIKAAVCALHTAFGLDGDASSVGA